MRFTFGKAEKLKSRKLIEQLFVEGESLKVYPLRIRFLKVGETKIAPKIAFSVPKRNFKRAVDRIRIKRLMREVYRTNKQLFVEGLNGEYIIMFMFTDRVEWKLTDLENKMVLLMNKMIQSVKEKPKHIDQIEKNE